MALRQKDLTPTIPHEPAELTTISCYIIYTVLCKYECMISYHPNVLLFYHETVEYKK